MDFQWDEELQRVFNEGLGWGRRRSPSIPPRSVNGLKQGVGGSEGLVWGGGGLPRFLLGASIGSSRGSGAVRGY